MPWWSWLLIWSGLVLALLAMLALFAVALFRKAVAVADALADTAETMQLLQNANTEAEEHEAEEQRSELAILSPFFHVVERRELVRSQSLERRAIRHEARLERARRLTRVDANSREWFPHR